MPFYTDRVIVLLLCYLIAVVSGNDLALKKSLFGAYITPLSCDAIVYNYEPGAKIHQDDNYECNSNPKNVARGHCIMGIADAILHCNQDRNCAGYGLTTNKNHHNAYDRDGIPNVTLYKGGSVAYANHEWLVYAKHCFKYTT